MYTTAFLHSFLAITDLNNLERHGYPKCIKILKKIKKYMAELLHTEASFDIVSRDILIGDKMLCFTLLMDSAKMC